jgi:hypothetical protein
VVLIFAKPYWTDTLLDVSAGQTVRFTATGTWTDWTITCGPEGYERPMMNLARPLRRRPSAPWFALCGALDQRGDETFLIGAEAEIIFEKSGRLFVFANDVPGFYFNNKGAIDLSLATTS